MSGEPCTVGGHAVGWAHQTSGEPNPQRDHLLCMANSKQSLSLSPQRGPIGRAPISRTSVNFSLYDVHHASFQNLQCGY